MNIIFENRNYSLRKRLFIFLIGGLFVLTPDIPKLFGIVSLHSIFFVPFIGAGLAFAVKNIINLPFLKLWIGMTTVLAIGGIGIDYIGNGVHVLYPFVEKNFSFSIISNDFWLILILCTIIAFRIIAPFFTTFKQATMILSSGIIIVAFLLGAKAYLKIELENKLYEHFSHVQHIETVPANDKWRFAVYTSELYVNGSTSLWPEKIIIDNKVSLPK
ncbi:hypothetical protein [Halobacillus mangrovi]|uniref:hypothetical protein n=1 Tax=Halobacillus mangrovi TaxID=402384 RepID=UPI003D97EE09